MVSTRSEKSVKKSALPVKVSSKSPSRGVKSASPSRLKKKTSVSPSRQNVRKSSPSRNTKTSPYSQITGRKSIGRSEQKYEGIRKSRVSSDSDSDEWAPYRKISSEKPKAAVRGRARNIENEPLQPFKGIIDITDEENEYESGLVRRSARISQQREVERVVHVKQDMLNNQKLAEFSEEDDLINLKYPEIISFAKPTERNSKSVDRASESRKIDFRKFENRFEKFEFGGTIGALFLLIFVPFLALSVNVLCNKSFCMFSAFPNLETFQKIDTYFDFNAWLLYYGFAFILFILSSLPFGGRKVSGLLSKDGVLDYRMNGLLSAVLLMALAINLIFYGFPIIEIVTEKYFHLLIASIVFGILLSIVLLIRSHYVPISSLNPHAVTKSKIYNFWMGRELNPRFFGIVDVKMYLYRFLIISSLLINGMFLYTKLLPILPATVSVTSASLFAKKLIPISTPLVLASLQSIYLLDGLVFESSWVTSFEIQYEGVGWMIVMGYLTYPFLATTLLKYVIEHNVQLPWYFLVFATVLFLIGFVLMRGSNNQKDSFRKNPYDPALSHLETIPTIQGKRLLISGFWGFVRHPNYLGDILIQLSLVFFVKLTPPVLFCLFDVLFLIARAQRDGKRCQQRYGVAWDIYCQRVKYVLLPKVY